ncbi:5-formyltetrahydrofolate cyclo-ligase, mitochondrial isoform X2 [Carica papaya]|uniref:5-formyltetrahydrofolate cyclo-ligase, mitochondrial isoform X2 n=1 Tax=Carica papaya TaxID=3649 RepID=UPI000B8CB66E|nr:5-formyltetrahydrofolate cyclo-ligase, mitochondrial isoform X2 [Carica papaya]
MRSVYGDVVTRSNNMWASKLQFCRSTLAIANPIYFSNPTRPCFLLLPPLHILNRATTATAAAMATAAAGNNGQTQEQKDILESIFRQKRILRSKVRKTLRSMNPSLKSLEDNAIQTIVLGSPWFQSCRRLCAYISCSSLHEVDTSKLLSQILQSPVSEGNGQLGKKKLYVPRVEDKNSNMQMLHISRIDDLIANSMNILEPAPVDADGNEREDVMQADEPVDLFVLPGLAFDTSGRRMGRGGGYYDTFLTRYQQQAKERNWRQPLLVALSYSLQILDRGIIPITPYDVPVDAIVTSSGITPISPVAIERNQHRKEAISVWR